MIYDIKIKEIQSFINKIAGISKQGDSKVSIGSTVQPVTEVFYNNVVKYLGNITTGNNTIWTPPANKQIILRGGVICISKDAACAGAEFICIADPDVILMRFDLSSAALVATDNVIIIPLDFGSGLSFKKGAYVGLNLNGALTAGCISCTLWGIEI